MIQTELASTFDVLLSEECCPFPQYTSVFVCCNHCMLVLCCLWPSFRRHCLHLFQENDPGRKIPEEHLLLSLRMSC